MAKSKKFLGECKSVQICAYRMMRSVSNAEPICTLSEGPFDDPQISILPLAGKESVFISPKRHILLEMANGR